MQRMVFFWHTSGSSSIQRAGRRLAVARELVSARGVSKFIQRLFPMLRPHVFHNLNIVNILSVIGFPKIMFLEF